MTILTPLRRALVPIVALAAAVCLAPPAVQAKRAPDPSMGAHVNAVAPALADFESVGPASTTAGIQRRLGAQSGLLRRYWRLTPSVSKQNGPTLDAKSTAFQFLNANASALGLDPRTIDRTLVLASEKSSPSGTHLRWNQVVNGVPVFRGDIVVKVSNQGEISSVQNNLRTAVAVRTLPAIDAARAVELGVGVVKPTGKSLGDYSAELNVVQFQSGPALVYLVSVPNEQPMGDWRVFVDAMSGDVLGVEDRMVYATGTGRVFDPDPETKMGNPNLPDNADADSGIPFPDAYDIRTLSDITNTAGVYSLSGPFAKNIEFESPTSTLITATDPDSFRFQRSAQGFEDVLCYFHLDNFQRYIQSLGFTSANNRVQEYDSHGLSGADNSHYIPSNKRIAFGEGGVDDGEDADIVIHEYGHSIQDNIVPGWGGGQEGAMGEGFGDYIAGSYSKALFPAYQANFVFNWDGHNEFWPGRLLIDNTLHYPEDCCGEVHDSGTLWCSGLTDAWDHVGRTVMDRIVFDHHFALGTSATMADAATQIIQSDIDLYGGAHVGQLVAVFDTWGFVNAEDFLPTIAHTPLTDTENTTGPYAVNATITSAQPLDVSTLKVFYGTAGITDSLLMSAVGPPGQYTASIPGPLSGVTVSYYIIAKDVNGGTATHPVGAPGSLHTFYVGPDITPPVIVHAPLGNVPEIVWPATVNATVTDNLSVNPDSVRVNWSINAVPATPFYLTHVPSTSNYSGPFPSDTTQVALGDVIAYTITARDLATVPNTATSPPAGSHSFNIIASRGTVLVLDDDEVAAHQTVKVLDPEDVPKNGSATTYSNAKASLPGEVQSANSIASLLNTLGFTATVEPANTSNPATWSNYQLLISSSGANLGPVANAPYRTALESYVAGGGKLLVEGGEVVFDAASSPGYPTFAANVLHSIDWDADNAGALQLLGPQAAHPIATIPNVLPASLPIAYTGFGSEDSYKPVGPAYIVYGVTAQAGNGGILVYDPTPPTQSAQIVVWGFDFKVTGDATTRTQLLENTATYLLTAEPPPTGSITGRVQLAGPTSHAGVTVQIAPGGQSIVTDSTGFYTIPGIYAASYTVTASKSGYATSQKTGVVVNTGIATSGVNFVLYPRPSTADCLSPGTAIPDNNPVGVTSVINVAPVFVVKDVQMSVNIPHTYIGDLIVELRHGAKTVRVHNRTGGSADNLVRTYPPSVVDGPGALANFNDDPSNGAWTLFVSDNEGADLGNIQNWCLYLQGPTDSSAVVVSVGDHGPQRGLAWLAPGEPNPMRSSGANIRFALAKADRATLIVYDVAGRKVRSLVDGWTTAGIHTVRWDGRDAAGRAVNAGVYLYRLKTDTFDTTQRMVVVP